MSIREQIIIAIMDTLTGWAPGRVFRSRRDAIGSREMPAVAVYPVNENVEPQMSARARRSLNIAVEIIDRGSEADQDVLNPAGCPPDKVSDETIVAIHRLIMGNQFLGGLCEFIDEGGTEWAIVAADQDIATARMGFAVSYITTIADLAVAA